MSLSLEALRQRRQLDILARGLEIEVGAAHACPLPPEALAAVRGDEPFVAQVFDSGLTAVVYRLHVAGGDWALKRARAQARVHNVDGQTSFLNEVQRRADITRLKAQAAGAPHCAALVDTTYASLRRGLILSPWIAGAPVAQWDERRITQLLQVAVALHRAGLFEWDYSPGNVLDDGVQLRLFDFGYMYEFDPLQHFNSAGNGRDAPLFHPAERFETRNLFASLLQMEQAGGTGCALRLFCLAKEIALDAYGGLRAQLAAHGARAEVLAWLDAISSRWRQALAGDTGALYLAEGWRSHVLDLDDDLRGRSCTPMTLRRADWILDALRHQMDALVSQQAFFWHDAGRSRRALLADYAAKRAQAVAWQVSRAARPG